MVQTPWGASGSLRERRLQPVRGTPQAEVERNQRERLFAALVASVAERGFAATTVSDLVDLSGVSSRSFYDLFGAMPRCMTALVEELLEMVQGELGQQEEAADFEAEEQRRYAAFAALIAAQPAAAKALLCEVFAAGPDAIEPVERAIIRYEDRMRTRYEAAPERAGMPAELITAIAGGVLEVARRRLRHGQEAELPALGERIVAAALSYRPPPDSLRPGIRRKPATRESLEAADHGERAIRAFAILCADQGYRATTVDDVVKLASMSSRTFYAHFSGKEDLMGAAIDSACAQLVAAATPAFARHEHWPAGVRAGLGALLGFLASRPALARLLAVEAYVAGDFAIERRDRGLNPVGLLLENNTTEWWQMPPVVYEMLAGGTFELIHRTIARSGAQALPGLSPILTYFALAPFFGPDAACAIANGEDGDGLDQLGRVQAPAARSAIPLPVPVTEAMWAILTTLRERTLVRAEGGLTAAEVASEIGEDEETVATYLRDLTAAGVLDITEDAAGEAEIRYLNFSPMHKLNSVSTQQSAQMSLQEREAISRRVRTMVEEDVDASVASGTFDQRPDRTMTRSPMRLDEQGWLELADLHTEMLQGSFEISARSAARLAESGEDPIEVRSVQMMFEMPREEKREA